MSSATFLPRRLLPPSDPLIGNNKQSEVNAKTSRFRTYTTKRMCWNQTTGFWKQTNNFFFFKMKASFGVDWNAENCFNMKIEQTDMCLCREDKQTEKPVPPTMSSSLEEYRSPTPMKEKVWIYDRNSTQTVNFTVEIKKRRRRNRRDIGKKKKSEIYRKEEEEEMGEIDEVIWVPATPRVICNYIANLEII